MRGCFAEQHHAPHRGSKKEMECLHPNGQLVQAKRTTMMSNMGNPVGGGAPSSELVNSSMNGPGENGVKRQEWSQKRRGAGYFEISDPVHGSIAIFYPIGVLIDTLEFNRLKNLKQNGVTDLVYPTAGHTRFAHSLGVYHLARAHVNTLDERQPALKITSIDKLCVSIAGLLHDLGHGPYSHTFEEVLKKVNPENSWRHEEGSKQIFCHMLKNPKVKDALDQYLSENDYVFIQELIDPPKAFMDENGRWKLNGRSIEKSFLYDIISNKHDGVDVDKFDYILRDSAVSQIAVCFNNQTVTRIQSHMEARKDTRLGYKRIVYGRKVREDVNAVFVSRESLHSKMYQHKTSVGIEKILIDALIKAAPYLHYQGGDGNFYNLTDAHKSIEAYLKTSDCVTNQIMVSNDPQLAEAQAILNQIGRRELLKCVGTTFLERACDLQKSAEEIKEEIVKLGEIEEHQLIVITRRIHRGFSDVDPLSKVLFYNHNDPYDTSLEFVSDQWLRANTNERIGKTNIYVYVANNTSLEDQLKVFNAFEKAAKYNKWETPAKRIKSIKDQSQD